MRLQLPQGRERRGAVGRRDGRREDERPRRVPHELRHLRRSGHIAAQRRQRLGEGPHIHVHLVLQAEVAGRATAALAQHAQPVGVVHHDPRAVLLRQGADLRQPGDVAAHGEHTVGDDQRPGRLRHFLQALFQLRHVAVAIAQHFAVGQLAPGVDAGVVLPVTDHIVVPPHQGGDNAHVGLEPGAEGHHPRLPQEPRQLRLQLQMHLQRAVEEPRPGAPGAVLLQRPDAGLDDLRVRGQTQIVVGAQHDAALALHHDLHVLPGLQGVEVGVHALLLQFPRQGRCKALLKDIHTRPLYLI